MTIRLASASPRRRELLSLLTQDFLITPSQVNETILEPLPPSQLVARLAQRKAEAVAEQFPADLIIGADTIVTLDGQILSKPTSPAHATQMLRTLSGRSHTVFTALHLCSPNKVAAEVSSTRVTFAPMSDAEIAWYIATGEPMDKAGAYGIQGLGARYIQEIEGDYFTVVGLPVHRLYHLLEKLQAFE